MFIDNKIIKIFRDSFLVKKSLEETQTELKQYRNTIIGTYNEFIRFFETSSIS